MATRRARSILVGTLVAALAPACSKSAEPGDQPRRGTATEPALRLQQLGKAAKMVHHELGAFPVGTTPLTPAMPCCSGADQRCAGNGSGWDDPTWAALDFRIDEPHRFQYAYQGTLAAFTARAVGDLDCDGTTVEYVLRGRVESGNPVVDELIVPANAD